ncbi:alpha/beta fold hydrolase [Phyllobacterium sp. SB3]|uniref:alpha/beta fold hydrolase n=1 Tax=Phyllobacterium sp. SB3 TaxID=3156073 RepID=UPI0032AF4EE9
MSRLWMPTIWHWQADMATAAFRPVMDSGSGMAVEHRKARMRDGVSAAYSRYPKAIDNSPRIVLIHSLALDRSVWDDVLPRLTAHGEIIAVDCRGHGLSDHAPGPYSIEMMGHDIADVLDDAGWHEAIIVGCSMGGCVAQAFAAQYPQRLRGLGLIDTTAWYGTGAPATWRKRAATAQAEGLRGLADFQVTRWFGDRFRKENPDRVKAAMEVFTGNDLDCYAATCVMLGDADLRRFLPKIKAPVAVIVGEEDYATPVDAARELQHAIKDATLTVLPGARHLTPIECPDAVAAKIVDLIGRVYGTHSP